MAQFTIEGKCQDIDKYKAIIAQAKYTPRIRSRSCCGHSLRRHKPRLVAKHFSNGPVNSRDHAQKWSYLQDYAYFANIDSQGCKIVVLQVIHLNSQRRGKWKNIASDLKSEKKEVEMLVLVEYAGHMKTCLQPRLIR